MPTRCRVILLVVGTLRDIPPFLSARAFVLRYSARLEPVMRQHAPVKNEWKEAVERGKLRSVGEHSRNRREARGAWRWRVDGVAVGFRGVTAVVGRFVLTSRGADL